MEEKIFGNDLIIVDGDTHSGSANLIWSFSSISLYFIHEDGEIESVDDNECGIDGFIGLNGDFAVIKGEYEQAMKEVEEHEREVEQEERERMERMRQRYEERKQAQ